MQRPEVACGFDIITDSRWPPANQQTLQTAQLASFGVGSPYVGVLQE
jgi:hypothetical protein